jgi:hypothetical protein
LFEAYDWPSLSDFWMPLTAAVTLYIVEKACMHVFKNWAERIQNKQDNKKYVIIKGEKTIENLFEGDYYLLTFILGTILL